MTALDARSARRRYLTLVALRWLPTGLLIPVTVLLALSRGLSLTEIGLVFSIQGLVVLALELPTGGLTDTLGRRPVLILASLVGLVSLGLLYVADSVLLFAASTALQGVFRALDSGPLEAWYVDATLAAEPGAEIEHGLSAGSTVLSLAIACGALLSGGLVALDPFDAIPTLALPLLVALALGVVNVLAITWLMTETPRARGPRAVASGGLGRIRCRPCLPTSRPAPPKEKRAPRCTWRGSRSSTHGATSSVTNCSTGPPAPTPPASPMATWPRRASSPTRCSRWASIR
jgi:MFS family permease